MTLRALRLLAILVGLAASGLPFAKVPDELTAEARKAEQVGRTLYENDMASAKATDEMFRRGVPQKDNRIRGWITAPASNGWKVTFVGDIDGRIARLYDVLLPREGSGTPGFVAHDPPAVLGDGERAMFDARTTALREGRSGCSDRYNTVVLENPTSTPSSWTVYVLAATSQRDEIVVGGHSRISVSADGKNVVSVEPLSKSCLRLQQRAANRGTVEAAFVTHLLSRTPSEIHVFLNLLHQKPILVGTSVGNWKVDNGAISFLGAR